MLKNILFIFSAAVLLFSCEKNALQLPTEPVEAGARLKLIHAAPDLPGIDLLIGGKKFSAFTPVGATTTNPGTPAGVPYNNTFPGNLANYALVTPGQAAITISTPASTTAGSATVVTEQSITLDDTKYYSLFVAGPTAKPEVLLLTDDFGSALDATKTYVRFINLTSGGTYDFALSNGTMLAPALAFKGVTSFIAIDPAITPSFVFRAPGTTANLGTITLTNTAAGRVITIFTRGVVGRTGTAAPGINLYINR
ncbi:DUF4397 domain-containing protein [Rudanella paleaurantiibacter]|uniref:DUF4397 domain-containing protein n=1 Tax=Rudanella paleaurantiibacter TaxID=2614655 RepID=A0A7J5U0Z9_9BACT|nr:DUF4397 domain-containing protein [Rudanella paleaurantiibacter]KAB7731325.1 DUF4397 domain-containing protein [Rudanella paleaurantiibacter]